MYLLIVFLIIIGLIIVLYSKNTCCVARKGSIELYFLINNLTFKIKGGFMANVDMRPSQAFEFDMVFKNKKGNPAFVDGEVPLKFVDPNTGDEITTTATATSTAIDPDENGDSSRHHVRVETNGDDITSTLLAGLVAEPDIDVDNDADDTTPDDVDTKRFDVMTLVFKPMGASELAVENITPVVDVP
jgi:hypothetical protein